MKYLNEKEKTFLELIAKQIESDYIEIRKVNDNLIISDNWYNIVNISIEQFKLKFSYLDEDKAYRYRITKGELEEI